MEQTTLRSQGGVGAIKLSFLVQVGVDDHSDISLRDGAHSSYPPLSHTSS